MATRTVYYPGGFDSTKPAGNVAEQWDTAVGYTAWNAAGAVTVQRALTTAEAAGLAQQDAAATSDNNGATLRQQALNALAANRTFNALASPTNAQTVAQVKALSQQVNALIRLQLGQLDATN